MDITKKFGNSFERLASNSRRAVKLNELHRFLRLRTIGDEHFKARVEELSTVLYRTLESVGPFDLDYQGPVTAGLLCCYCNRAGIENLKNTVASSRIRYRKDISAKLAELLGMSEIFLENLSAVVRSGISDYDMELEAGFNVRIN